MKKNKINEFIIAFSFLTILMGRGTASSAEPNTGAPVQMGGVEIFRVYSRVGSFSAEDRAKSIQSRIENEIKDSLFSTDSITVSNSERSTDINGGDVILVTVTDEDAKSAGKDRLVFAEEIKSSIKTAITDERASKAPKVFWHGVILTLGLTVGLCLLLFGLNFLFKSLRKKLEKINFDEIKPGISNNLGMVNPQKIVAVILRFLTALKVILTIIIFFFYIPLAFSFFPETANFAPTLLGYVLNPLKIVWSVTLAYIPDFFFTVMILIVTRYFLKVVHFVFLKLESGAIQINGFHQDWAQPTYKLVRVLVFALALVVVFPYLPGSKSPAFKGISVFLGILFSFGSSSAISNLMAGIVLTYMRPFKLGDRVQVADTQGDVIEKSLLVTRIRTIKNVEITIPNSMVLGAHISNFSSAAKMPGLILNTTITIGYDAPWKSIHELLIKAANETALIVKDPKPFVLQTSLDNSYVSYQINAYTHEANRMAQIYSDLYQNIQDVFNAANVEIMSPTFAAIRDGNALTIPAASLSPGYEAPSFRIFNQNEKK